MGGRLSRRGWAPLLPTNEWVWANTWLEIQALPHLCRSTLSFSLPHFVPYRRHILPQHKWLLALPSSSSVFTCTFRWLYEVRTTRPKLDAGRLRLRFSFIHLFSPGYRANNCRFLLFFYSLKFVPRELPVLDTTTVRRDYYVICT